MLTGADTTYTVIGDVKGGNLISARIAEAHRLRKFCFDGVVPLGCKKIWGQKSGHLESSLRSVEGETSLRH
jgi:hypothetical protein